MLTKTLLVLNLVYHNTCDLTQALATALAKRDISKSWHRSEGKSTAHA